MMTGTNYGKPIEVFIDDHPVGVAYEVEMREERPIVARDAWDRPVVGRVYRAIHLNRFKEYK